MDERVRIRLKKAYTTIHWCPIRTRVIGTLKSAKGIKYLCMASIRGVHCIKSLRSHEWKGETVFIVTVTI